MISFQKASLVRIAALTLIGLALLSGYALAHPRGQRVPGVYYLCS